MTNPAKALAIKVRPAEERDITALARLAGELGYPSTPEQVRERFAGIHASDRSSYVCRA